MRGLKLQISLAILLSLLFFFSTPTEALAAINRLNNQTGSTQTFQNDTNVAISSSNNTHSLVWQGMLPVSRGGTGANSFTAGSVLFSDGNTITQNNLKLFWDNANGRLGIGTSSPTSTLDVRGDASITGNLNVTGNITGNLTVTNLVPYTGATGNVDLGSHNLTTNSLTSTNDSTINGLTIGKGGGSNIYTTAYGVNALSNNTTGSENVAIGFEALYSNTTGSYNTAVGFQVGGAGGNNTAVGYRAGGSGGVRNTAVGSVSLLQNTTGVDNTAIGAESLVYNTASHNVAVGSASLRDNTTGDLNVAIGNAALLVNLTGGGNVAVGYDAGRFQADGSTALSTPNGSIYLGISSRGYDNNDNNSIVLGSSAIGAGANTTVIGNSFMTDVYFGSQSANASIHTKKLFLGSSSIPGCLVMGDTNGGVGYVTLVNGVLTSSTTPPSACQ